MEVFLIIIVIARVEIENSLNKIMVAESSRQASFCAVLTKPRPDDSVRVRVIAVNVDSAVRKLILGYN